jgi:hypothetical protein
MPSRREPSFERLCEIIREQCHLHPDERITFDTQFERDLGITGDDGDYLLRAVAKEFEIEFDTKSFDLRPNEYLFNSEVPDLFGTIWRSIRGKPEPEVRSFAVGELYEAVLKGLEKVP